MSIKMKLDITTPQPYWMWPHHHLRWFNGTTFPFVSSFNTISRAICCDESHHHIFIILMLWNSTPSRVWENNFPNFMTFPSTQTISLWWKLRNFVEEVRSSTHFHISARHKFSTWMKIVGKFICVWGKDSWAR